MKPFDLQVVLSAWQYHQGTATDGVPQYTNAKVAAAYLSSNYPGLPSRDVGWGVCWVGLGGGWPQPDATWRQAVPHPASQQQQQQAPDVAR